MSAWNVAGTIGLRSSVLHAQFALPRRSSPVRPFLQTTATPTSMAQPTLIAKLKKAVCDAQVRVQSVLAAPRSTLQPRCTDLSLGAVRACTGTAQLTRRAVTCFQLPPNDRVRPCCQRLCSRRRDARRRATVDQRYQRKASCALTPRRFSRCPAPSPFLSFH